MIQSANAILFLVNFALGRKVTKVYVFPGGSAGIQYSIDWSATGWNTPENILKDSGFTWTATPFTGDVLIVDLGAEQRVTGLEIQGEILVMDGGCGGICRAVKRAKFHGSLANDGPWTVILDHSWEETNLERPKETIPIPEARVRFVKLENVETIGTHGPGWKWLSVLTGRKAITDSDYSLVV